MKYGTPTLAILFLLLQSIPLYAFTGMVVSITDGETIKVLNEGSQVKVRLYGIDCPEKKQAFGQKAKDFTASLVAGKFVEVVPEDTDIYSRTVGLVFADGKSVNLEIVKAGYAWVYRHYCKAAFCFQWLDDEAKARKAKIGLWHDKDPTPPWEWRKKRRED